MAARLNARHSEMVRDKIRASQLVNRLEDHVFGDAEMTASQVQAALGLLKKCVPDLSAQTIAGDPEGEPLRQVTEIVNRIVDPRSSGAEGVQAPAGAVALQGR